jgi:hypothetical protein
MAFIYYLMEKARDKFCDNHRLPRLNVTPDELGTVKAMSW